MMKLMVAFTLIGGWAMAQIVGESFNRNIDAPYNFVEQNVGLKGYDPVGYFPEGGGSAQEGVASITENYGGVVYRFANEDNRQLFLSNPEKYEPTYGGWCAWAMANETPFVNIDPKLYRIHGNRAHFFISRRALAQWDRGNLTQLEDVADRTWTEVSGELPRL